MKTLKNSIKLALIIASIGICSSCTNSSKGESQFKIEEGFVYAHLVPDSLRTPEQTQICKLLDKVTSEFVIVKDNHLALSISEKEFIEMGIPKQYYDLLQHDLEVANHYIDSTGTQNVDQILIESRKNSFPISGK